jgi:hypothetical protein
LFDAPWAARERVECRRGEVWREASELLAVVARPLRGRVEFVRETSTMTAKTPKPSSAAMPCPVLTLPPLLPPPLLLLLL